jgi:methionyl-tRNA synthetase
MVAPVMPESMKKIHGQLGLTDELTTIDPGDLVWGQLQPGTVVAPAEGIFPRIEKNKIMSEIKEQTVTETRDNTVVAAAPVRAEKQEDDSFISIDDFLKVELRVGEIKVAERIPNADKLLRFEIDLGEETPRQILAGLAEYYEPEKLIGRKVVVVANLKPRKMRGLESQGMICAASLGQEDTPAIATFIENVEIGARLK